MAAEFAVTIPGEGTRRLACLHSVLRDLQWVKSACVLALRRMAESEPDAIVTQALQVAALVRYCRCFDGDAQTPLSLTPAILGCLPPDLKMVHNELLELRAKYIAHSVYDLEDNVPTVHLAQDETTGAYQISNLSIEHRDRPLLSQEAMKGLFALARICRDMARAESESEKDRLLTYVAQAMEVQPVGMKRTRAKSGVAK